MGPGHDEGQQRPGRPRDARLDDAIVHATLELLADRGFDALTLAAVAERAGTTTPAIYRRWSSKSDLVIEAVFRTEGDEVAADTGDLAADLRSMVRWTLEKLGSPVGRAALAGLLGGTGTGGIERLPQVAVAWRRVADRLARAAAADEIRDDVRIGTLVSLITGPAMMAAVVHGDGAVDRRFVDDVVSVVLDGARPGPAPARRTRRPAREGAAR